ncbi:PREDICTED: VQ motif-containing protein 17-like [Camelina sativa]|uniref:VQ motif-containing protein 17-like n=1 Tax=Camelina sativa TaxID=90675 RepID=A0ABM0YUE2_CAMSA|nr:PREDICTED: VQ motif-containing protein 17-like [Camelina sativa]
MEIEATTIQKRRSIPTIAMHKQSKTLTKSKPKIRIIHIFAPEIIKTDVSNFREIVQNLTGKQDHYHDLHHQKVVKRNPISRVSHHDHDHHHHHQVHDMNKSHGFCINSEAEDEEEEGMVSMTWNGHGGESSGGFLNGLGDYDGFIQELGEFPYMPLAIDSADASSHLHGSVFAEPHQYS